MRTLERRKYPRYGFQSDVEWQSGSETCRTFISDISMGGMFIVTEAPLHVGVAFTARLLLNPPLILECTVCRVLPGRGMGVTLNRVPDRARARLEKLIASLATG